MEKHLKINLQIVYFLILPSMKPDLDRHFIFFSEPYYNFPIQWFSKSNIAMVYTPREQKGSNFNEFFPI
jgi:hypothetical protein